MHGIETIRDSLFLSGCCNASLSVYPDFFESLLCCGPSVVCEWHHYEVWGEAAEGAVALDWGGWKPGFHNSLSRRDERKPVTECLRAGFLAFVSQLSSESVCNKGLLGWKQHLKCWCQGSSQVGLKDHQPDALKWPVGVWKIIFSWSKDAFRSLKHCIPLD